MNYTQLAMRTNSNVTGQNPEVTPDLLHATLGMADELFEYNMSQSWLNAVEELGDLCWFIALAGNSLDHDAFDNATNDSPFGPVAVDLDRAPTLTDAVASFVGSVKKSYAYGKALDTITLRYLLDVMVARIALIAENKSQRTLDEVLTANIAKLEARYPEKFTQDAAIVRSIKQEAAAMRGYLQ